MSKDRTNPAARLFVVAAFALSFLALSSVASASTVEWKGVTFETQGTGTATIDSNGDLLLTPDGDSSFGLHVNRIPNGGGDPSPINANGTPFISFSYVDPGTAGQYIDFSIQDETVTGQPRIQAGSLFGASQVVSATYGDSADRNANEQYLFFTTPRTAGSHDVVLGKTADNTYYASFDGEQRSSDIFKNAGIDFDFNDVYLRVRNGKGSTFHFTDLTYGDNFSPSSAQAVPEPGSLLMFGLGVSGILLLLSFGRARRSHG